MLQTCAMGFGGIAMQAMAGEKASKYIDPLAPKPCHFKARAKNVIFLYMSGGMTHVDTFDPKTPSHIAGATTPLATNASGLQISNHLPNLAKQGDKFAVVRSMTTKTGDHAGGNYLMHTGFSRQPGQRHPQMGSWAQYFLGRRNKLIPDSIVIGGGNPGPGVGAAAGQAS